MSMMKKLLVSLFLCLFICSAFSSALEVEQTTNSQESNPQKSNSNVNPKFLFHPWFPRIPWTLPPMPSPRPGFPIIPWWWRLRFLFPCPPWVHPPHPSPKSQSEVEAINNENNDSINSMGNENQESSMANDQYMLNNANPEWFFGHHPWFGFPPFHRRPFPWALPPHPFPKPFPYPWGKPLPYPWWIHPHPPKPSPTVTESSADASQTEASSTP